MISLRGFCTFVLLAFSLPIVHVAGADHVDFQRQILPIFQAKCFDCHGPEDQEGQLRLDAKAAVFRGGVSGPSVVAGKSGRSPLVLRLTSKNDDERMPLDEEPLTAEEIQLIRRWIDEGAVWPDGVGATLPNSERHWAYVLPKRWPFPKVIDSNWANNPLDLFVLARLENSGLKPSPRADGARLLRRVYLDLIGLPPSVEDLDAFLNDSSQLAYENAVDRLLASPRYGEQWARPWLDLARYADSNGYQADQYRNVWPYRDWVIRALNDDMPFSQFTIEQIAGDLLPGSTVEQKIATGFHRLTTCNVEAGVDPEENRVNQVIDRVNTTGTVWLGTTVECAQCHNHKYDPFTQRDYYRLFAYFNNTPLEVEGNGVQFNFVGPKFSLPLTAEQQVERGALKRQMDERNKQLATAITTAKQQIPAWEKQVTAVAQQAPKWHVLKIDSFRSSGGASHTILDDHSVLVGGAKPDKDAYTISASTELSRITGFKIETLTDPSLPGKGPGRHDPARPNFVLHEFQVAGSPAVVSGAPSESLRKISLHSAAADFSQKSFPVANAIDGNAETAWAINPQFGKPHWATFFTTSPFGFDGGTKLTFTLDQHFGGGRTIGRLRISAMTGTPGKHQLPAAIAKILSFAPAKRNAKQRKQIENHFINQQPQIKKLRMHIAALQKQVNAIKPVTTLVMVEQEEHRKTHVFKRGSFLTKGEEVTVGTPRALPRLKEMPRNRLGLARWLVDSSNPLTSRVAVNRWWTEIFGQGIVHTIEDFGTQGDLPTHPRLLDWLACELVDSGWSMKHIHRLIVTSATYRQSSRVTQKLLRRDPYNKLYARGPRFRLPAESIRDNALAISGVVSTKMGGPPVYPPQPAGMWRHVGRNAPKYTTSQGTDRYRRGVYVVWRRSAPYASFTNFDAPDRASCVVNRSRTNTPIQALTLMNDAAYIELAGALAERIARDRSELTIDEKIIYGFRLCTARKPAKGELSVLREFFARELARLQSQPKSVREILTNVKHSGALADEEFVAWLLMANVLLNLDETITKG